MVNMVVTISHVLRLSPTLHIVGRQAKITETITLSSDHEIYYGAQNRPVFFWLGCYVALACVRGKLCPEMMIYVFDRCDHIYDDNPPKSFRRIGPASSYNNSRRFIYLCGRRQKRSATMSLVTQDQPGEARAQH